VNVYLTTDLIGFELAFRPVMGTFSELPMFEVVPKPLSGWSSVLKALEDYLVAGILVVMLLPLFAIIALLIKLESAGPVFFVQKRLGFNNEEFSIYKFRSMRHNQTDETVVRQARRGDPRVTRVGRIIRATSLDELPQLFNVLNGTMSLVGPRPHAVSHNEEYGRQIRGYFARHKVKPGITGWAQVNGLRGETDTIEKMEARIRHDIYYADNWSLLFDLRILVMTAALVLFQKSAY
jgi:Undecaprenyl-phosphate glucose phosphotransferase